MFSRALQFLAGRAVDAAGSAEGCFPAPQSQGMPMDPPRLLLAASCPPLQPALHACPRRTIFGLNIPAHSPNLTVGMSIPISCKHFFRLKDPDCRRPSHDSAPCDFPGIRPGWATGAASPSPTRPAGRHLLIHPHLLLPQPDNATARAAKHHPLPRCSESSCLTRAMLIFPEPGSCCLCSGRSVAPSAGGSRQPVGCFPC